MAAILVGLAPQSPVAMVRTELPTLLLFLVPAWGHSYLALPASRNLLANLAPCFSHLRSIKMVVSENAGCHRMPINGNFCGLMWNMMNRGTWACTIFNHPNSVAAAENENLGSLPSDMHALRLGPCYLGWTGGLSALPAVRRS